MHSSGGAASSDGTLSLKAPTRAEPADNFSYDPANPVPSLGSQYQTFDFSGPRDRSGIQSRDDVLTFTTEPLMRDIEVTGPIRATIWASSDAVDTDFTATLTDLDSDGKAIALCEGIVRARFRNGTDKPAMMNPGEIYKFEVDMWNTSNLFKKGHCIRVEVSSSNFPRYNRNLNSGNPIATDTEMTVANQSIYHDTEHPSYLTLPVIYRNIEAPTDRK